MAALMAPNDPFGDGLNSFAQEYNNFITELQKGKFDHKRWQKCEKLWRRLSPCDCGKLKS